MSKLTESYLETTMEDDNGGDYEESQAQAWEEEIMTMLSIAEEAE